MASKVYEMRNTRPIAVRGEVALVTLSNGLVATIDAEDVPRVSGRFAAELQALVAKYGQKLTDNEVITALDAQLKRAWEDACEPMPELPAMVADLTNALRPFANLGVGSGPDEEHDAAPYRILRGAIRNARTAVARAGG